MYKYFILVWRMGKFHFVHFKLFCGPHGNKTRTRGQGLPQYKERTIWYFELDPSGCDDFWEDAFSFRAGDQTSWMTLRHLSVYPCSKRLEILCGFFFFFWSFKFIYSFYFLVALSRLYYVQAFSGCSKQGLLFIAACGLLIMVASLVGEHRLSARGAQ